MLDVARDHDVAVNHGCSRDQGVHRRLLHRKLAQTKVVLTPEVGNRFINADDPPREARSNSVIEPVSQTYAVAVGRTILDARPNFRNHGHTEKSLRRTNGAEPPEHAWVRRIFAQLRQDIGIDEEEEQVEVGLSIKFLAIGTRKPEASKKTGHGGLRNHPKNTSQLANKGC